MCAPLTLTRVYGLKRKSFACSLSLFSSFFSAGHRFTSSTLGRFLLTANVSCILQYICVSLRYAFDPVSLYKKMGATEISLIQLLAYLSSCCNPITYCFMNEKFRNAFLSAFGCGPQGRFGRGPNRSTDLVSGSLNDSVNLGRRPYKGKII